MGEAMQEEQFVLDVPEQFVDRGYEMDPALEDIWFGDELHTGMVVLLEDGLIREDRPRDDSYARARFRETARWCKIERFRPVNDGIISFVAVYADGTKRVRTYNKSYAWFVKKATI
jgi:hypothetical protein